MITTPSSVITETSTSASAASMEEMLHSSTHSFIDDETAVGEAQRIKPKKSKDRKVVSPLNTQRHFASMRKRSVLFAQPDHRTSNENSVDNANNVNYTTSTIKSNYYNKHVNEDMKDNNEAHFTANERSITKIYSEDSNEEKATSALTHKNEMSFVHAFPTKPHSLESYKPTSSDIFTKHNNNSSTNSICNGNKSQSVSGVTPSSYCAKRIGLNESNLLWSSTESLPRLTGPDINVENIIQIEGLDKIPVEPYNDIQHTGQNEQQQQQHRHLLSVEQRSRPTSPRQTQLANNNNTHSRSNSLGGAQGQLPALYSRQTSLSKELCDSHSMTNSEINKLQNVYQINSPSNVSNNGEHISAYLSDTINSDTWRSFHRQTPSHYGNSLFKVQNTANNSSSSSSHIVNDNISTNSPTIHHVLHVSKEEMEALSAEYNVPVQKVEDIMLAVQSDRSLTIAILKNLQDVSLHDHYTSNNQSYYNSSGGSNSNDNNINNNNNIETKSAKASNINSYSTNNEIVRENNSVANAMVNESVNNEYTSEVNPFIRLQYSTRETVQRVLDYLHLPADRECDVVKALNKANGNGSLAAEYIRRADARAHRRANRHRLKRNISISENNKCDTTSDDNANEALTNVESKASTVQTRQSTHNGDVNKVENATLQNNVVDNANEEEIYTDEEEDEEDEDDLLGSQEELEELEEFSVSGTSFESTINSLSHAEGLTSREAYLRKHKRAKQKRMFCLSYSPRSSSPTPSEQHRIEDVIHRLDMRSLSGLSGSLPSPSTLSRYPTFGTHSSRHNRSESGEYGKSTRELRTEVHTLQNQPLQNEHYTYVSDKKNVNNNNNNITWESKINKLRYEFPACSEREIVTGLKLTDGHLAHARVYLSGKNASNANGINDTRKEHIENVERVIGNALANSHVRLPLKPPQLQQQQHKTEENELLSSTTNPLTESSVNTSTVIANQEICDKATKSNNVLHKENTKDNVGTHALSDSRLSHYIRENNNTDNNDQINTLLSPAEQGTLSASKKLSPYLEITSPRSITPNALSTLPPLSSPRGTAPINYSSSFSSSSRTVNSSKLITQSHTSHFAPQHTVNHTTTINKVDSNNNNNNNIHSCAMRGKEEEEAPLQTLSKSEGDWANVHLREGRSTSLPTNLESSLSATMLRVPHTMHNNWNRSSVNIDDNNTTFSANNSHLEKQDLQDVNDSKVLEHPEELSQPIEAKTKLKEEEENENEKIIRRRWTEGDAPGLEQRHLIPSTPSATRMNARSPREAMIMMSANRSVMQNNCSTKSPIRHIVIDAAKESQTKMSDTVTNTNTKNNNGFNSSNCKKKPVHNAENNLDRGAEENNESLISLHKNQESNTNTLYTETRITDCNSLAPSLSTTAHNSRSATPLRGYSHNNTNKLTTALDWRTLQDNIHSSRELSNKGEPIASALTSRRNSSSHNSESLSQTLLVPPDTTPPHHLIATLPPPPTRSNAASPSPSSSSSEEQLSNEIDNVAPLDLTGSNSDKAKAKEVVAIPETENKEIISRTWRGSVAAVNMNDANLRSMTAYQVIPPISQAHNNTACKKTSCITNSSELRNEGNLFCNFSNTLTPITQSLLDDTMKNISPRRTASFAANTKHNLQSSPERLNNLNNNVNDSMRNNIRSLELNKSKEVTSKWIEDKDSSIGLVNATPPLASNTKLPINTNAPLPPPPPPPPPFASKVGLPINTNAPLPPPPPPPPFSSLPSSVPSAKNINSKIPSQINNGSETCTSENVAPIQRGPTKTLPINAVRDSGKSVFKDANTVELPVDIKKGLVELFHRPEIKNSDNATHAVDGHAANGDPSSKSQTGDANKGVNAKPIAILDPGREHNVAIVLQFLRLPIQQIEASVRTFDELTLGEEHIAGLSKIIPNPADLSAIEALVQRHGGKVKRSDAHQYSLPVRFFLMTTYIDHYAERIRAWGLKLEFYSRLDDFEGKLRVMDDAVSAVLNSQHLPEMLIFLLNVSNFLNTGSRFQGAKGFPITQLPQIINFRTTDGKGTLLSYVVHTLEETQPKIHEFTQELMPYVESARDIDVGGIAQEVKNYHNRLQQCASLVRKITNDVRWTNVLGKFIYKALPVLEKVEQLVTTLHRKLERLREFVCEPASTFSVNEVLRVLTVFCKRYDQERERQAERAARKAAHSQQNKEQNNREPYPREATLIYDEQN